MIATAPNLIRVRKIDDTNMNYAYAPPTVDALLSVNLIQSVEPVETRLIEKCVAVKLTGGDRWRCVGTVDEMLAAMKEAKEMAQTNESTIT